MVSFLFNSHTAAQNILLVIYLFTGGILEIVAIILGIIPKTKDLMNNVLIYLFRLLPNFALADALTNLITRSVPLTHIGCPQEGCAPNALQITGWDLVYMGVGSLVWFVITLFLELALATPRLRAMFQFQNIDVDDGDNTELDLPTAPGMESLCSDQTTNQLMRRFRRLHETDDPPGSDSGDATSKNDSEDNTGK